MAGDHEEASGASGARGPEKLMQRARQLGGTGRNQPDPGGRVVMPSDVMRGEDGPTVPVRDPHTAPSPRPRTDGNPEVPPNVPADAEEDADVTEVGRLPPNPVTGRPADGGLDVVPVPAAPPTVRIPDPDEATQVRIDPDVTVIHGPGAGPLAKAKHEDAPAVEATPAPKHRSSERRDTIAGKPKLATAEDLGGGSVDLQQEPLLKWIAIGLGLMVFVSGAFAVVAVLVIALAG